MLSFLNFIQSLNYIQWDVSPTIIEIFGREIRWYGLLFGLGFILGQKVMEGIFRKEGKPLEDLDQLLLYMIGGTVLGARLGHCLFYDFDYYWANPIKILYVWEGGLASHGGAFGVLFAIALYARKHPGQSFLYLCDRLVIVVALAGACIRMGNLMNSEIIGSVTNVPWAFVFTHVDFFPRHPAQLYESLSCIVLFLGMWKYYYAKSGQISEGSLFGFFLAILFTLRFFYEFLKENQEAFEDRLPINMGQILSIPFVCFGVYLMLRTKRKNVEPKG